MFLESKGRVSRRWHNERPKARGTNVTRWLCYFGALIALGVGITSFVLPILIAGVALAAALVAIGVRSSRKSPSP